MASRPPSLPRSNITACIRCRQKKKRCDQKVPKCGLCEVAGANCVGYDAVARRPVSRSYVLSLEERVAHLESRLRALGPRGEEVLPPPGTSDLEIGSLPDCAPRDRPSIPPSALSLESGREQDRMNEVRAAVRPSVGPMLRPWHRRPEDEPPFSKVLLGEILKSKSGSRLTVDGESGSSTTEKQSLSELVDNLEGVGSPNVSPLPPIAAAQMLVKSYFEFTNLGMPLLHEPTFRERLGSLYEDPSAMTTDDEEAAISTFRVFEVFAIAILVLQKRTQTRLSTTWAERYHRTALKTIEKVGTTSDLGGLQNLLLLGQYWYHHPTVWATWKTIGASLRLAVELGLHEDVPAEGPDALMVDDMRKAFWVAYSMEKNISIALGMPSCLSDGAITAKFPSSVDDEFITPGGILVPEEDRSWSKYLSIHLFRYRQIQSEMQTILSQEQYPVLQKDIDYAAWQKDMHTRIRGWYDTIPQASGVSSFQKIDLENFELTYYRALLYLYQPSTNIPTPSEDGMQILVDTISRIIPLYRRFFLENRLSIYWQAVENLFSAGTTLLYCYIHSELARESITLQALESLLHVCSSILWGMVERFPAFKEKRDAFDQIVTTTMAEIRGDVPDPSPADRPSAVGNPQSDIQAPETARSNPRPLLLARDEPFDGPITPGDLMDTAFDETGGLDLDWMNALADGSDLFTVSWL